MAKTVYLEISAKGSKVFEKRDGSFGIMVQVEDDEVDSFRTSPIFVFAEGDDWKQCPNNWKNKKGEPAHIWFGHDIVPKVKKPKKEKIKKVTERMIRKAAKKDAKRIKNNRSDK